MSIWTSNHRVLLRRARADFDGPFPVYAAIGEKKAPLSDDQIAAAKQQALDLAGWPAPQIQNTLAEMLEADSSGTEPPMDIAGFMRGPEPYGGTRSETMTDAPKSCDQCGRDLNDVGYFFDACTIENMMWSWMCPPCFFVRGCGVGNGYGQLYLRADGKEYLILGEN